MPTKKPRIAVTLDPNIYETVKRLGELQGVSGGRVIAELLETIHPPLMRTVALLEAARDAPRQVTEGLRGTIEQLERELVGVAGGSIAQMDWMLSEIQERSEAAATADARRSRAPRRPSNPRHVTRGSGTKKQQLTKRKKGGRNG